MLLTCGNAEISKGDGPALLTSSAQIWQFSREFSVHKRATVQVPVHLLRRVPSPSRRRLLDEQLAVLRLLVDRRRSLGEVHTRNASQLHQLLLDLIPGGAKRDVSKALLTKVRTRDAVGRTRRRVATGLVADLERIHARRKAANKELTELVRRYLPTAYVRASVVATGSTTGLSPTARRTSKSSPAVVGRASPRELVVHGLRAMLEPHSARICRGAMVRRWGALTSTTGSRLAASFVLRRQPERPCSRLL